MRKILLTLMLVVGVSVSAVSQNSIADKEINRYISYQLGSRSAETNPTQLDMLKSKLAERLQLNTVQKMAYKGANPAIGANFKQYTPHNSGTNGLSEVFVRFVEEDSKGNLYFSTNGIDRWNGFEWENFNPTNSMINATTYDMLEDRNGNIWLASFSGVIRIDVFSGYMQYIGVDQGLRSQLAYTLHEAADGNIYVGHRYDETYGGGVTVLDSYGSVLYTFAENLYGSSVEDIAEHDGKLYIATAADPTNGEFGSISVYDMSGDSVLTSYHKDNSTLPYNEFNSVEVDNEGNIWASYFTNSAIGHTEGGIVKFNGTTWTHYSKVKGNNVGVNIRDLKIDSNDNLWIAAQDGLFKYDGQNFTKVEAVVDGTVTLTNLSNVNELSGGRIAISNFTSAEHNGGVFFYDPSASSWEYLSSSIDNGANSNIYFGSDYDSKGNLWITGFYGVQKFDGENWTLWTKTDGLGDTYAWDLIVDNNDNVWANTAGAGISRINTDGSVDVISEYGNFDETNYQSKDGDLWFGDFTGDYDGDGDFESNGILHYDGISYTVYDTTDGLPTLNGGAIYSLTEDQQGRILAATDAGVYRLENGAFTKWEFEGYTGSPIINLFLDSQNRLWISGPVVYMYDGTNWHQFDSNDGVESWNNDITEDLSGRVWFTQSYGAAVYDNGIFHRVSSKNGVPVGSQIYALAASITEASEISMGTYGQGVSIMDTELPVTIADISDNPNDEGGWIRVEVDGYLLSSQYTGGPADAWRVEMNVNGNWETASPLSPISSRSISVQVPVTKPSGVTADESNSFEFRVVALSDEDGVVGISEIITAYAEDNIVPAQVQSILAETSGENVTLSWDAVDANDLSGYAVYESVTDFGSTEPLAFTTGLTVEITDKEYTELIVVAKDRHNNYSAPSTVMIGTGIEQNAGLPDKFDLKQNYPNPFNPVTKIAYALPQSSHVKITVYNSIGQQIAVLLNAAKPAGNHEVNFNAGQLNSGMYIYRIEAAGFTQTRKMMLIK